MTLPNFLIIGAMKCGTTTLRSCLKQHPNVYIAPRELHFFDRECNFRRGIAWYEDKFDEGRYRCAIGEKTPAYSFVREAPERIYQIMPEVKLIWIFRDPVARAYSNYWHRLRRGDEWRGFDKVVERGLNAEVATGRPAPCEILAKGRYSEQITRYSQFFSRTRMHFIMFEKFVSAPKPAVQSVFDFLGVKRDVAITADLQRNAGHLPRSAALIWFAKKAFGSSLPYNLLRRLNRRGEPGYPPMAFETRKLLADYYRPFNQQLAEMLNWELAEWGSQSGS